MLFCDDVPCCLNVLHFFSPVSMGVPVFVHMFWGVLYVPFYVVSTVVGSRCSFLFV